ncbi:MAG: hypothetical protein R3C68_18600 [Myxococcota bacterium]
MPPSTAADSLEKGYFNNEIWPDFTKIPNPTDPSKDGMLRIERISSGEIHSGGPYSLTPLTVHHSIETQACFATDASGATLVYSGDTGPTDALWPAVNQGRTCAALSLRPAFQTT